MHNGMKNREVIIEILPFGQLMRVSAMDVKTLTEIVISCPKGTPETVMKANALKRMEYVLKKKGIIS